MKKLKILLLVAIAVLTALAPTTLSAAEEPPQEGGFYLIGTAEHLRWFRDQVNSGNNSISGRLTQNIDLSTNGAPEAWTPIGGYFDVEGRPKDYFYQGVFDGAGREVFGYKITAAEVVEADYTKGREAAAGLFGVAGDRSKITDLVVKGALDVQLTPSHGYDYLHAGGVAGISKGYIGSCVNEEALHALNLGGRSHLYLGGIVGACSATIENCVNNAGVVGNATGRRYVGGIAGSASGSFVRECVNNGGVTLEPGVVDIQFHCYVAGIAGYSDCDILNCVNNGHVTAANGTRYNSHIGGITGSSSSSKHITNCLNSANVASSQGETAYVGGIVGFKYNSSSYPNNVAACANLGKITTANAKESHVGGGVGYSGYDYGNQSPVYVSNCANSGEIVVINSGKTANAGSLIGCLITPTSCVENLGWLEGTAERAFGAYQANSEEPAARMYTEAEKSEIFTTLSATLSSFAIPRNGGSATIDLATWPANELFAGAVVDVKPTFSVEGIVGYERNGNKITLTPLALGRTILTLDVVAHATDLSADPLALKKRLHFQYNYELIVTTEGTPVEGIAVRPKNAAVSVGGAVRLTAAVTPEDATDKSVIWTSDNNGIARVTNGTVTGVAPGKATITAKTKDGGFTDSCVVTVNAVPVEKITVTPDSLSLEVGGARQLTAAVEPVDATNKNIIWSTSDRTTATVDAKGLVVAAAAGSAVITATAADGSGVKMDVSVNVRTPEVAVEKVTVEPTAAELPAGTTLQLKATVTPVNATNKEVRWKSGNADVATVDAKGLVKAIKDGKAVITAAAGGKSATCEITVPVIKATAITVTPTEVELEIGGKAQLMATVEPENASNKNVQWNSSNKATASVNGGVVVGHKAGNATITAKALGGDNVTTSCKVTVKEKPQPAPVVKPESVTLDRTEAQLKAGATLQLTATVLPENAADKSVTWSSDNTKAATVDAKGLVKAVAKGEATITVKTNVEGKWATCKITVTEEDEPSSGGSGGGGCNGGFGALAAAAAVLAAAKRRR